MNIGDSVLAWMWSRVTGTVIEINEDVPDDGYLVRIHDDQVKFYHSDRIWMSGEHLCPTSIPWPPPGRVESHTTCPSCGKEARGWCECGAVSIVGDEDYISFSGHRIDVGDEVDVWDRSFCEGVVMSDEQCGFHLVRVEGAYPPEIWYTIGSLERTVSDVEDDSV